MQPPSPKHTRQAAKEVKQQDLFHRVGIKSGICACNKNKSKKKKELLWGIKKGKNQSNASHVRRKVVIYNKDVCRKRAKSKKGVFRRMRFQCYKVERASQFNHYFLLVFSSFLFLLFVVPIRCRYDFRFSFFFFFNFFYAFLCRFSVIMFKESDNEINE